MDYGYYINTTVIDKPLSPARTEASTLTTSPLTLTDIKEHLGLHSGGGDPIDDPSLDNTLNDYLQWGSDMASVWLNSPVSVEGITDYYTSVEADCRLILSSQGKIDRTIKQPALEVILDGESDFTAVTTYRLDETARPVEVIIDEIPSLSEDYNFPVRFVYEISQFDERGVGAIRSTMIDIIRLRWDSRGTPIPVDGAIHRILDLNLSPIRKN